jgi:hypothetical protein
MVAISAAVGLGVTEDLMLPVAALLTIAFAVWQRRHRAESERPLSRARTDGPRLRLS